MKDIAFIQPVSLVITGTIKDSSVDLGLLLYQKIVLLVLSSIKGVYRQGAGTAFIEHIGKSNLTGSGYLKSLLLTACLQAKQCLDLLDSNKIQKISVLNTETSANITILLKTGEIYTGTIK